MVELNAAWSRVSARRVLRMYRASTTFFLPDARVMGDVPASFFGDLASAERFGSSPDSLLKMLGQLGGARVDLGVQLSDDRDRCACVRHVRRWGRDGRA